ncbi:MAG: hypothetical protein M3220_20315 [Chloroflexota bacterium]|nr:hypothetical protein [Chloroflexota bacterium]
MDRGIPVAGNEEIELYMRTYYSLLRSSGAIRVKSLEETHAAMDSSLHSGAEEPYPDIGAFTYAYLRLPPEIMQAREIVLGQSEEVFERRGYLHVDRWELAEAPARRRKMFFRDGILAAFIASVSDIDDLIPIVVTFQIEWNKMHYFLTEPAIRELLDEALEEDRGLTPEEEKTVQEALSLDEEEWRQLHRLFGDELPAELHRIAGQEMDLHLMLLASSLTDYKRATQAWWDTIATHTDRVFLRYRPVYFVSSNMHSLVNLLAGYAREEEVKLVSFLKKYNPESLWEDYEALQEEIHHPERYNLLYYALKYYREHHPDLTHQRAWEVESGVQQIENPLYLDVAAQVIELNRLVPERFDPRIKVEGVEHLRRSNAIIFNVDYPLGMAAYQLLSQVTSSVGSIRGVYIIGKAATLNGRVGDIMIPNVVYDEHSQNTFLFRNVFTADDLAPYLLYNNVFDNQKAVTVRGTLLQNRQFMGLFYKEGYTDIEMEAGPYLSAVYENIYPKRYPVNEIVNLFINARYDIGILHYASDTPYSKRKALLSEGLSYRGVDSTYGSAVAVLRRIFEVELQQLTVEHQEREITQQW